MPIAQAMAPADIASVKGWARRAHEFFPRQTARILRDVDQNRPVGKVRDEFRDTLGMVNDLEREVAARKGQ